MSVLPVNEKVHLVTSERVHCIVTINLHCNEVSKAQTCCHCECIHTFVIGLVCWMLYKKPSLPCHNSKVSQTVFVFGSFSLSTKEPYIIMLCPLCVILRRLPAASASALSSVHSPPITTGLIVETSYLI